MPERKITNLGATATEHDTADYTGTPTSGDQTSYAKAMREADAVDRVDPNSNGSTRTKF